MEDLDFADDIALHDEIVKATRDHIMSLQRNAKEIGLKINTKKTKIMAYPPLHGDLMLIDDMRLEQVDDFKYLGCLISNSSEDLRVRRRKDFGVFWSMTKVWKSHDLPMVLKLRIFDATCRSDPSIHWPS